MKSVLDVMVESYDDLIEGKAPDEPAVARSIRDLSVRVARLEASMPRTIDQQIDAVYRDWVLYWDEEWPGDLEVRAWIRRIGYMNVLSALAQAYSKFRRADPATSDGRTRYFFGMMIAIERNSGRWDDDD